MICPIISKLVEIKGAEAIAGSIFILLKNNGSADPINVATMILQNSENDTIIENIIS